MRARHRLVLLAAAAVLTAACGTGVAAPTTTPPTYSSSSSEPAPPVSTGPQVTVAPLPGQSSESVTSTAGSSSTKPSKSAPSTTGSSSPGGPVTVTRTTSVPGTGGNTPTTTVSEDPTTITETVVVDPPSTATTRPPVSTSRPRTSATKPPGGGSMTRKIVVIDPGHNGANGANPGIINQQVNAGFGQMKPCNTTGTETNAGYPEHAFNWQVALHLKAALEAKGITVVMTRNSDDGVGPCVDKRAAIGNQASADAVISIHGDGDDAAAHGFYVMTAGQAPDGIASGVTQASARLAVDVRDGLAEAGLTPNTHLGSNGLWTSRTDLAGLNLSLRPTVMIEAGNMRNSADAALMTSQAGQQQVAQGLAIGVVNYLIGR